MKTILIALVDEDNGGIDFYYARYEDTESFDAVRSRASEAFDLWHQTEAGHKYLRENGDKGTWSDVINIPKEIRDKVGLVWDTLAHDTTVAGNWIQKVFNIDHYDAAIMQDPTDEIFWIDSDDQTPEKSRLVVAFDCEDHPNVFLQSGLVVIANDRKSFELDSCGPLEDLTFDDINQFVEQTKVMANALQVPLEVADEVKKLIEEKENDEDASEASRPNGG